MNNKKSRLYNIYFLTFFLIFLLPFPAFAKMYIVNSITSSTDWAGAEWTNYPDPPICTPCTPLTAMQNAQPGDTVFFRGGEGGNYTVTPEGLYLDPRRPVLRPKNSGTSAKPIIIRNYPGEIPHIQSDGTNRGALLGVYPSSGRQSYIIIDGFKLSAPNWSGEISIVNCDNCIVRNCEIIGVTLPTDPGDGGNYDGIRLNGSTNIKVYNCKIHGMKYTDRNHGNAVKLYNCSYCEVYQCTMYDTNAGICDKNNGQHNTYRQNLIRTVSVGGSYGIVVGTMAGGPDTNDIKIYQNIILTPAYDSCDGIYFMSTVHDAQIYNNVIFANSNSGLNIGGTTNQQFWNNIIINTAFNYLSNGQPTYLDYNTYYNRQSFAVRMGGSNPKNYSTLAAWQVAGELISGGNPDVHSIYADPKFVNLGGTNAEDYKLRVDSPCRGTAGKDGVDMGAYPNGDDGTIIGYKDPFGNPPPSPPSLLSSI